MASMFSSIRVWGEMIKFSHSVFALPFAAIGAFLAGRHIDGRGWPYWGQLGLVLICMVAGRSVAMTFNRIVDAKIDARNPRTAGRPLPAGKMSQATAFAMLLLTILTFGVGCVGFHILYDNTWPILLSGPVLVYLCLYSYAKRFTRWAHFVLGSAIAMSPAAAWLAIHPLTIGIEAALLMASVIFWIAGFDIIYACLDIEFDRGASLHSLPAKLGPVGALRIARVCHVLTVAAWITLGFVAQLGYLYAAGVCLAAVLLAVENSLVKPGDYGRVNLAFFTFNGAVSIMFATLTIIDILV